MPDADKDILYKVAYEEAVRALSEQQGAIDSFRTRAGLLLSAAAITTSFLGAQALDGGDSNLAIWLAMVTFVGVAVASLGILWPRRWEFTANPRDVIQTYIEADEPAPIEELHRDLSLHMHNSYIENREGQEQLSVFFQVASGLLTIEVILWIIAIASTRRIDLWHSPHRPPPRQSRNGPARCSPRRADSLSARPSSSRSTLQGGPVGRGTPQKFKRGVLVPG